VIVPMPTPMSVLLNRNMSSGGVAIVRSFVQNDSEGVVPCNDAAGMEQQAL
jgi:hypothetical protein